MFRQTIANYTYHPETVDVGLIQSSALQADIAATLDRLSAFIPFPEALLDSLARKCRHCRFIICDISPLGIAVAKKLEIPSVLVENFTWDWIYDPYYVTHPQLAQFGNYFAQLFEQTDIHIQTEPLCKREACDLHCGPIFRKSKGNSRRIKEYFAAKGRPVILLTLGGVDQDLSFYNLLQQRRDLFFVVPGCRKKRHHAENIFELERHTEIYHPDLIEAADLVVCKAGYSTIAECYQAGSRVLAIGRDDCAETIPLQRFLSDKLGAVHLTPSEFLSGNWLNLIEDLLSRPKPLPAAENGADVIARYLQTRF